MRYASIYSENSRTCGSPTELVRHAPQAYRSGLIVAISTTIMHPKVFGFGATHLYTGKINAYKFLATSHCPTSQVHFMSFCASPNIIHPRRNSTENSRCRNAWCIQLGKLCVVSCSICPFATIDHYIPYRRNTA